MIQAIQHIHTLKFLEAHQEKDKRISNNGSYNKPLIEKGFFDMRKRFRSATHQVMRINLIKIEDGRY